MEVGLKSVMVTSRSIRSIGAEEYLGPHTYVCISGGKKC